MIADVIKRASSTTEFLLVVAVSCGYFFVHSLLALAEGPPFAIHLSSERLQLLLVVEGLAFLAALPILALRGWRLSRISWGFSGVNTLFGVMLLGGYYLLYSLAYRLVFTSSLAQAAQGEVHVAEALSLPIVLLVASVNPVFEEFFLVAYVTKTLARQGWPIAIGVSTLLRLLIHVHQGPLALPTVLPIGVLFAAVYWRHGQLWPIVFAHGLADFIGLASAS